MRQAYTTPSVVDYGSIADATFVTPAVARKQNIPVGNMPAMGDGNYQCSSLAGVYALGLYFMRRRNSSFLDGVGADARVLADHIARWLDGRRRGAA